MRIIIISQKERHSEFPFHHTFYEAGENPKFEAIRTPELDRILERDPTPVDLFIIEALRNEESTVRMLQQVQRAAPEGSSFIIYHSEAEPKDHAERAKLKQRFLDLGANGFADVGMDAFTFTGTLLETAGLEPKYDLLPVERAIVPIGDFHFDLLARKAYYTKPMGPYDDDDEHVASKDTWKPLGMTAERLMFAAKTKRGIAKLYGPQMRRGGSQTYFEGLPSFDITEKEARLIDVLRSDNRNYYEAKLLILDMHNAEFSTILPEAATVKQMRDRITAEIANYVDNAERYILYSEDKGFMLNEVALEIDPDLTRAAIEEHRASAEVFLQQEMYPAWESDLLNDRKTSANETTAEYKTYVVPDRKFLLHDVIFVNLKRGSLSVATSDKKGLRINDAESLLLEYLHDNATTPISAQTLIENIYSGSKKPSIETLRAVITSFNDKFKNHFGINFQIIRMNKQGHFTLNQTTKPLQLRTDDEPDPSNNL